MTATPWYLHERGAGRLCAEDAVLCRNTKPLVEIAYSLIRHSIACHVEGREIGAGLLKLCDKWRVRSADALRNRLETWLETQVTKLTAKGQEAAAGALTDRVETLYVLLDGCATVDDLRLKIQNLFQDTPDGQRPRNLTLSTIHKAKGREWNRVYWYGSERYQPSPWARRAWELTQEDNLCYVAATRAKQELVMVAAPPKQEGR